MGGEGKGKVRGVNVGCVNVRLCALRGGER